MSHFGAHAHSSCTLLASNIDKNKVNTEINATKVKWSYWFHQGKAFVTVDNRSYAQVLESTSVDNSARLAEKHQTRECSLKVNTSVNRGLVNKVVNDISTKPQQSVHRPSVNRTLYSAKQSHNDTVSTPAGFRYRFQVSRLRMFVFPKR